jgi:hypothetical protein
MAIRTCKTGTQTWSHTSTWVEGVVPLPADSVLVLDGAALTVDVDATIVDIVGSQTQVEECTWTPHTGSYLGAVSQVSPQTLTITGTIYCTTVSPLNKE